MTKLKIFTTMLASFALTAFIFLNGYEIAFTKDLKYIDFLEKVNLASIEHNYVLGQELINSDFSQSKYGAPKSIKVSDKHKLELVQAVRSNNTWLARANAGHFAAIYSKSNPNTENILIYARESLRTISDPLTIEKGDIIHVGTNQDWGYIFRVEKIDEISADRAYVLSEHTKSSLIILLQNTKTNTNTVVAADYIVTEKIAP